MTKSSIIPQKGERRLETLWEVPITLRQFKQLRKKLGDSATAFGRRLGISRSYVKHIEGGSLPVRPRVASRFRELSVSVGGPENVRERVIISRFKMPEQVRLLMAPRKCRGHRRWMIFRTPQQVYCSKECERLWRKKQKSKSRRVK